MMTLPWIRRRLTNVPLLLVTSRNSSLLPTAKISAWSLETVGNGIERSTPSSRPMQKGETGMAMIRTASFCVNRPVKNQAASDASGH